MTQESAVKHAPEWRAGTMQSTGEISVMKDWDWTGKAICRGVDTMEHARLIAAAPELLQALRALSDICAQGWIPPDEFGAASPEEIWNTACAQFRHSRAFEMALTAIKKAKGE